MARRKLGAHPRQIQNRFDLAHEMIGRNNIIEMELVAGFARPSAAPIIPRPCRSSGARTQSRVRRQRQPTFATKSAIFCLRRTEPAPGTGGTSGGTAPWRLHRRPPIARGMSAQIRFIGAARL
jgi:hypothetical protein